MKVYGLVGYPLSQSFSQKHFTQKFANENIEAEYLNFSIESIGEFPEIVSETENISGLNITIPYKERVLAFLDQLDPIAKKVGAVNVVKFTNDYENKILVGYNTDVVGFEQSLLPLLKTNHTTALILGTGGASKAVKYVLNKLGITYRFVTRKPARPDHLSYQQVTPDILKNTHLVINCTPLGMFPNVEGFPALPYNVVTNNHLFYDLIYNPAETLFLQNAKQHGASIKNGLEMLILQAEEAWKIWNS